MSAEEQIRLHSARASAELDLAFDAISNRAAECHFALSKLHRQRIRALAPPRRPLLRIVR